MVVISKHNCLLLLLLLLLVVVVVVVVVVLVLLSLSFFRAFVLGLLKSSCQVST